MDELRILYNLIERSKGFAFDFECVDRETGKPTVNPLAARPTLLSIATGVNKVAALCLEWSDRARKYLQYLLSQSHLTAVAHYGNYDFPVAHWNGIDLEESKATWSDTRLLCWLQFEEDDLGLKNQVMKHLDYKMQGFKSAAESDFAQRAKDLKKELKRLPIEMRKQFQAAKRELKAQLKETKHAIEASWKGKIKQKEINAKKKKATAETEVEIERVEDALQIAADERADDIKVLVAENEALSWKVFRKYAVDDAKQTWRLYRKTRRWVHREKMNRWLRVELANYRQSIMMGIRGAYVDQGLAQEMIGVSTPLLDEFQANVFNMAKREFNINSAVQMAEVLYRDLGIRPLPGTGRSKLAGLIDKEWGYNADKEVLERIDHPIGQAILDFRSVHTIFSNFMKGFLKQAQEDPLKKSRVHVNFNSTGTVTGRWSSSTQS
jgi:DNA polymerase I-like protein with 3'-5' exonuclease and polymerase domains